MDKGQNHSTFATTTDHPPDLRQALDSDLSEGGIKIWFPPLHKNKLLHPVHHANLI